MLALVALYIKIFFNTILAFFEDYWSKTTNYDNNHQLLEQPSTESGRIEIMLILKFFFFLFVHGEVL